MPITIKEIAALAGVSIGTVDRALHNRGRVNPELAARIIDLARENGYEPSRAGRALALARNPVRIGVVVHLTRAAFMQKILSGIYKAKAEFESLGAEIIVREIPSFDVEQQLSAIDGLLAMNVRGIAISPADDSAIRDRINRIGGGDAGTGSTGIPVVTFNTDIGSKRMCFVGLDNTRGGTVAAGLMGMLTGGQGKVAVITGHLANQANIRRVEGFTREMRRSYPGVSIAGVQVCYDEDSVARQLVLSCVKEYPGLSGFFIDAGGQAGLCTALEELGLSGRMKVVAFDLVPAAVEGLKRGAIDFVIDQNAFIQGYRPVEILFEYLFNGHTPKKKLQHTDILIKTKHNL